MSLNRAYLVGYVATVPRTSDHGTVFLVATLRETGRATFVDRHRVHETTGAECGAGTLGFVEGAVTPDRERRRRIVEAHRLIVLDESRPDATPPTTTETPARTHASPVTHERAGYFRRVGLGTARERLTWVRATTIHGSERATSDERHTSRPTKAAPTTGSN